MNDAATDFGFRPAVRSGQVGQVPWLLAIWAFVTLWNWDKAFHIDDTAHLEIARWIAGHGLHPMSGLLNWDGVEAPIHRTNQPHLYFYLMAGWAALFGWGEHAMHALQAVFALLAIAAFHSLARRVVPARALLATALLALGPAFVVNQNSMVEIPLAAMWIGVHATLLGRRDPPTVGRYLLAGALAGAAILTKYTAILLVPALLLDAACRPRVRRPALLAAAALPVAVLLAWSLFNWLDYGGVHILQRPVAAGAAFWPGLRQRAATWLICLGAVAPFAALFFAAALRRHRATAAFAPLAFAPLAALALLVAGFLAGLVDAPDARRALKAIGLLTGCALAVLAAAASLAALLRARGCDAVLDALLLGWWGWGAAGFVVAFAPFMANRHVLVSLPPFLLLAAMAFGPWFTRAAAAAALAATLGLTAALAAADNWYAGAFREQARAIRATLPAEAPVWFTGHWGWQWYAEQAGMRPLALDHPQARPGDFIVERSEDRLPPEDGLILREVARHMLQRPCCTPYLVERGGGFYMSSPWQLPWALDRAPIETFTVYQVGPWP